MHYGEKMTAENTLSHCQREFIIEHVDGPRPIRVNHCDMKTARGMARLGFVRWHPSTRNPRPTHTALTDEGRALLGATLALYADLLNRAGIRLRVEAMIEAAVRRSAEGTSSDRSAPGAGAPIGQAEEV